MGVGSPGGGGLHDQSCHSLGLMGHEGGASAHSESILHILPCIGPRLECSFQSLATTFLSPSILTKTGLLQGLINHFEPFMVMGPKFPSGLMIVKDNA